MNGSMKLKRNKKNEFQTNTEKPQFIVFEAVMQLNQF